MTTRSSAPQSSASELDWSETRNWIGRNLIVEPAPGVEVVERSTIRRQVEVLEMDCPLHWDEEVAKKHGYRGLLAPHHMWTIFAQQPFWQPGDPTRWPGADDVNYTIQARPGGRRLQVPTPGTAGFVSDLEMEYLEPVCVGDRITSMENKLVDVNPRKTRVGDGAFLTYENKFVNQRGQVVAVTRMTNYSYVPAPRQQG